MFHSTKILRLVCKLRGYTPYIRPEIQPQFIQRDQPWYLEGERHIVTELFVLGFVSVSIVSYLNGNTKRREFKDVLYIPKLRTNLFSIGAATDSGIDANFSKGTIAFLKNNLEVMHGRKIGKSLYPLKVIAQNSNPEPTSTYSATSMKSPFQTWHQRLAHVNRKANPKDDQT